jgi:hypothetical protein
MSNYKNIERRIGQACVAVIATATIIACSGCGATVTINLLSSHSRYGQAVGGTETTIKGQIEGGGNAAATVPLTP